MTNDVLRSVRYMLDLADANVVDIIKLTHYEVSQQDVASWLKKEGEEGFAECPNISLAHFLDGLVIFRRGKNENTGAEPAARSASNNLSMSNNQALKQRGEVPRYFCDRSFLVQRPTGRVPQALVQPLFPG